MKFVALITALTLAIGPIMPAAKDSRDFGIRANEASLYSIDCPSWLWFICGSKK